MLRKYHKILKMEVCSSCSSAMVRLNQLDCPVRLNLIKAITAM